MRAELSGTDGLPPPGDLPQGDFWATTLADGSIRIDRADPRILISGELLDQFPSSHVQLDTAACRPGHGYVGAVLKINGINRTVIYRIVDMVPRINGYIGEWPD
jgi:hypothetical protein